MAEQTSTQSTSTSLQVSPITHSRDQDQDQQNKLTAQTKDRNYMDILLRQARRSLEDFLKPDFLEVTNAPLNILQEGKGILFATVLQDGNIGAGIFVKRLENNKWSAPCAVLLEDAKLGLLSEFQRTKHIIVFKDHQYLNQFCNGEQITLKDDNSISTFSIGRDCDYSVEINEIGYEEVKKISTIKGTNLEDTLNGLKIRVDDQWNQEFYKKPANIKEIFGGNVQVPHDIEYNSLCTMLKQCLISINRGENTNMLGHEHMAPQIKNVDDNREHFAVSDLRTRDTMEPNKNPIGADTGNTINIERSRQSETNTRDTNSPINSSKNKTTVINNLDKKNIRPESFNGNSIDKSNTKPTIGNINNITRSYSDPNKNAGSATHYTTDIAGSQSSRTDKNMLNKSDNKTSTNNSSTAIVFPSNMLGRDNRQTNYSDYYYSNKY